MSKILILNSGLKHAQDFVEPFVKRLEVYLSSKSDCVDIRNTSTFDERTFFEYDQVIFVFTTALDSIPSSTLEIFHKLEKQPKNHTEIYAIIACDEYETEKCDLSEKIIKQWCYHEKLHYKGSLKIASVLFIMKGMVKYVVASHLKAFAASIIKHDTVAYHLTMPTEKIFMKKANQYWNKEIRKKHKEKMKDAL